MDALHSPCFVLAPAGDLPLEPVSFKELTELQARSIAAAERLRMFRVPDAWSGSLDALIDSAAVSERPFCDALVPAIGVESLHLGVYELRWCGSPKAGAEADASRQVEAIRCLDRVPLRDVANEACWFYPTEDGAYLSWSNRCDVRLEPGHLPDRPPTQAPVDYRHDRLRLLWSLMADEEAMTCVGLTYNRRRIEWPVALENGQPTAAWTWFSVDSRAERPYRQISRCQRPR
ncbi:MAG: hypothetical protein WBN89_11665 [Prochlorococcaceae cyanobacterium]